MPSSPSYKAYPSYSGKANFISLFSKMLGHQKYFKIVNKITSKIHCFILEFHNTKFYIILLVDDIKLIDPNINFFFYLFIHKFFAIA
jgi:hypothetical protein